MERWVWMLRTWRGRLERRGESRKGSRWRAVDEWSTNIGPVKIREPKSRVISVNRCSRRSLDPRQADRQITGPPELCRRRSSVRYFISFIS